MLDDQGIHSSWEQKGLWRVRRVFMAPSVARLVWHSLLSKVESSAPVRRDGERPGRCGEWDVGPVKRKSKDRYGHYHGGHG